MARKIVALVTLLAFIPSICLAGSMSDYVTRELDTMRSQAEVNSPSYIRSQERGFATFGSFRMNYGNRGTLAPFTMNPPALHTGCSGVDMTLGGLGFMEVKYIIDAFKKIISSALPAFAFQLAMSSLCSQCNNIMSSLQRAAHAINAMTLDKCKASQTIAALGVNLVQGNSEEAEESAAAEGMTDSLFKGLNNGIKDAAAQVTKFEQAVNRYTNCDPEVLRTSGLSGCDKLASQGKLFAPGSMVRNAIRVTGLSEVLLETDQQMENLMRAMLGDVIVKKDASNQPMEPVLLEPQWKVDEKNLFLTIMYGTDNVVNQPGGTTGLQVVGVDDNFNETDVTITVPAASSIYGRTETALSNIYQAMSIGGTPTAADLRFLYLSPIPTYKLLNVMSVGYGLTIDPTSAVGNISRLTAASITTNLVVTTVAMFQKALATYKSKVTKGTAEEKYEKFMAKVMNFRSIVNNHAAAVMALELDHLKDGLMMWQYVQELEGKMLQSVSASALSGQFSWAARAGSK